MSVHVASQATLSPSASGFLDAPEGKVLLLLVVTLVFAIDTWTGSAIDLGPLYTIAVLVSCRASSLGLTATTVMASAVFGGFSDHILLDAARELGPESVGAWVPWWNGGARLVVLATVAFAVRSLQGALASLGRSAARLRAALAELENARVHIRTLEGMLPICAWCGRMRDIDGAERWLTLDEYVRERTSASVTHGICPECARKVQEELSSRG